MNMYNAVIFDLDGTLLNTIDDIKDSVNYALKQKSLDPFLVEDYYYFVGQGVDELIKSVLIQRNQPISLFQELKKLYLDEYTLRQNNKTLPYEGIVSLLESLRTLKVSVNVLSNKPHLDTLKVIDYYFKEIDFTFVYGKKEGYLPKPDGKLLQEMVANLQIDKSKILYVGDTSVDMITAENANLTSIGVLWGFRKEAELVEHHARFIVSSPLEILQIVKVGHK